MINKLSTDSDSDVRDSNRDLSVMLGYVSDENEDAIWTASPVAAQLLRTQDKIQMRDLWIRTTRRRGRGQADARLELDTKTHVLGMVQQERVKHWR